MKLDFSVVIASTRATSLSRVLDNLQRQSVEGINYEYVIVQESNDGFEEFTTLSYGPRIRIFRQSLHHDTGAAARDRGIAEAYGTYIAFWDDDNIYFPHAIATTYSNVLGHDIGIVKVKHKGTIIPSGIAIKAGDIDTMCLCVKKDLAITMKWADGGGRYNDFRWVSRIVGKAKSINYSPIIIGEHL